MKKFFYLFLAHTKSNIILAFLASFFIAFGCIITPCVDAYNPQGRLVVTPPDSTGVFNILGYKVFYARLLDCPPPILWCFLDYSGGEWSYSLLDKEEFLGKFMLHAKKISLSRPELKAKFNVFEQYKPRSNRHPPFMCCKNLKIE
jgi:hypothetical protein